MLPSEENISMLSIIVATDGYILVPLTIRLWQYPRSFERVPGERKKLQRP